MCTGYRRDSTLRFRASGPSTYSPISSKARLLRRNSNRFHSIDLLRSDFIPGFAIRKCKIAGESTCEVHTGRGGIGLNGTNNKATSCGAFLRDWMGMLVIMAQEKDVMNCWILGKYGVFWTKLDLDFKRGCSGDSHCLIG